MNSIRPVLFWLFSLAAIMTYQQKALAQHSELGVRVVLSGALMFGPYYSYWIDDHHSLNSSVLAALEEEWKVIVPFALNAGYTAHFFKDKWRPEIGIQYSYLISPRRFKSPDDPAGISILSLVPGVQYRWSNTSQNLQSRIWLASFLDNWKSSKDFDLRFIGFDFSYGYKYP